MIDFLQRGRGGGLPTVQHAAPPGSDMGNSAQRVFPLAGGALGDSMGDAAVSFQGRASLTLLAALIVGSVVVYMATRNAQGS